MLRIYLDEDSADHDFITALRGAGFDVLTTAEAGHLGLDDDEQLAFATVAGRPVVTANRKDFARLHAQWMRTGRRHPGIIVRTRQSLTIGEQLRAIEAIAAKLGAEELRNRLEYMTQWLTRGT